MAERRHPLPSILSSLPVTLCLLGAVTAAHAQQDAPTVRVSDLHSHMQGAVTVVGRTGFIAEQYERRGVHVFTLRDDYDGQVLVRTPSKHYPVMGTTYRVTGWPTREHGTLFLNTLPGQITAVYPLNSAPAPVAAPAALAPPVAPPAPPSVGSQALLWAPSLVCLLVAAGILAVALRRWLGRPQTEWGELLVTSGPDRGLAVPLRRRRVVLGRGVSAARHVRFSGGDQTISNEHAVLTFRRGELFLCDHSSNGTRVGGERLEADQPRKINSGDLIHLGTRGTVVIVRLRAPAPAPAGLLGLLREPSPVADKTIMMPDAATDDPAWMRATPEAPERAPESAPATAPEPPPVAQAVPQSVAAPAREAEAEEDTEEEDSIPHTHLSPMIFSFGGHSPRGGRPRESAGAELLRDAGEEAAPR